MTPNLYPTAIHEAGHCLVATSLGVAIDYSLVNSRLAKVQFKPLAWALASHSTKVKILLAGETAMDHLRHRPGSFQRVMAGSDGPQLAELYFNQKAFGQVHPGLSAVIADYWPAVERLANKLLTHSSIDGDTIKRILAL